MSQQSAIEWTDATWNPVRGCVKVSPGCANCYAETFAERFRGVKGHPYEQGFDLRLVPEKLTEPLTWKKPRRVFVNSMSDLFQDGVPWSFIEQVFDVMRQTPQHTYQVLTKRADNMRQFAEWWAFHHSGPMPNVWLGVSVENQHFADERIPLLLQTPSAVRFISAEPLLGPVNLREMAHRDDWHIDALDTPDPSRRLDWVIVGGESGPGARPCQTWWIRNIVRQCQQSDVPVFVKQMGAHILDRNDAGFDGDTERSWPMDTDYREDLGGFRDGYQGAPVRILLKKKGGDPNEWPADLRVREFPSEAR